MSRAARAGVPQTSVAAIEGMERPALLLLWAELLGGTPPHSMSQPVLRRVLAWELQARAHGGLPAAMKRLESLATSVARVSGRAGGRDGEGTRAAAKARASSKLKPSGRFLREWNGVTHVVESGFLWRGEQHRSLSAIARAITGAHWSGPRFFGLQQAGESDGGAKAPSPRSRASSKAISISAAVGGGSTSPAKAAQTAQSRRRAA